MPNVITALELERMVRLDSEIRRPSDRQRPGRVAFIQCVGSRDLTLGHLFCSRICCGYALRMSKAIRHRWPDTAVTVFYMDIQNFGKEFLPAYEEARETLTLIRGIPGAVSPTPGDGVAVGFQPEGGGPPREEVFDLLVLSVGLMPSPENSRWAERLGLPLNEDGFLMGQDQGGIFTAGTAAGPMDIAQSAADGGRAARAVADYLGVQPCLAENKIGILLYHKEKRAPALLSGEDLKKAALSFPEVEVVGDFYQDHWELSVERLSKDMAGQALSRLIIVSPQGTRVTGPWQQEFNRWGFGPDQVSVVNVHPAFRGVESEPELIREKSILLLKQAIVRQGALEPVQLESVETVPRILILGGGLAGRMAAQGALTLGLGVLLLDSGKTLGPVGYYEQAAWPEGGILSIDELFSQPGLQAVTEARLLRLEGQAGNFTVRFLDGEDRVQEEKIGAVLVALPPESKPNFTAYGLKESRKVLPLSQLETMLSSPEYLEKMMPSGEDREVAFLLGLTAESGPPVVGRALRDARRLQSLGNTQVYFLSGNMKVAAEGLEREYTQAREEGVIFFRFTAGPPVIQAGDQGLQVELNDEILGRPIRFDPPDPGGG